MLNCECNKVIRIFWDIMFLNISLMFHSVGNIYMVQQKQCWCVSEKRMGIQYRRKLLCLVEKLAGQNLHSRIRQVNEHSEHLAYSIVLTKRRCILFQFFSMYESIFHFLCFDIFTYVTILKYTNCSSFSIHIYFILCSVV